MPGKKKTEILIGFTSHYPSVAEKEERYMKNADVILAEMPPDVVEGLAKGRSIEALALGYRYPEQFKKRLTQLKKSMDEGKTVIGYESFYKQDAWTPLEYRDLQYLEEEAHEALRARDTERFAQVMAQFNEMREHKSVEWIKSNLTRFRGKKIYIEAGENHTPIYHQLKKELKPRGISVESVHANKGLYEHPRIKAKYPPSDQLMRIYRFKTTSSKNWEKIRELVRQDREFREAQDELGRRYEWGKGLSHESAIERSELDLLRRQTRKGLRK